MIRKPIQDSSRLLLMQVALWNFLSGPFMS